MVDSVNVYPTKEQWILFVFFFFHTRCLDPTAPFIPFEHQRLLCRVPKPTPLLTKKKRKREKNDSNMKRKM